MQENYSDCKDLLEKTLRSRYGVELHPFGNDTPNPGVRFDFRVGDVGVHGALWRNLSFDLESVDFGRKAPLLNESHQLGDRDELEKLLNTALAKIDEAGAESEPKKLP